MNKHDDTYDAFLAILKEELISATGCTEPISIALAAAKAKEVLGKEPLRVDVRVSESIIKNAKSVIVPNTNNLKGIKVATSAGIIVGKSIRCLDVISEVNDSDQEAIETFLNHTHIDVGPIDSEYVFDVQMTVYHGDDYAKVRIINHHTNFVLIEHNHEILLAKDYVHETIGKDQKKSQLTVKAIVDFAETVEISEIKPLLDAQIENNMRIADEGLNKNYGANIGSVLMKSDPNHLKNKAKAMAAAASDARMGGSKLPVTIVSGSGNQGITASIPVVVYARALNVKADTLYRALVISNLVTIHQKTGVGSLSAYCGAVFSGAGSGAGIAYLHGGKFEEIAHTIVNALAIISGMICDGAKPSCAAKIATAVDTGILGYEMYLDGQEFLGGDGIIAKGVEETIRNVGRLARDGMRLTDKEIVKIMTEKDC